uniref:Uncharacterized protein n=1 Tax=Oryza punctata TaxID=4537 RepID=A0A0E0JIL1_ORYPU
MSQCNCHGDDIGIAYCSCNHLFQGYDVWAAIGTTIFITPWYLVTLWGMPMLRDTYIEKFAMNPAAGRDGSNLPSGNC